jgi:hypothetical protein
MSITELMQHVGDENVQLQNLESSLIRAQMKKDDGEITFATDRDKVGALAGIGQKTHLGLVVWLPIDKLPENLRPKNP